MVAEGLGQFQPETAREIIVFSELALGGLHSCGLRTDNTIHCWFNSLSPQGSYTDIAVGTWHTCGTRNDGTVHCWERNSTRTFDPIIGRYTDLAGGSGGLTCGIRTDDNKLRCGGVPIAGPRVLLEATIRTFANTTS